MVGGCVGFSDAPTAVPASAALPEAGFCHQPPVNTQRRESLSAWQDNVQGVHSSLPSNLNAEAYPLCHVWEQLLQLLLQQHKIAVLW